MILRKQVQYESPIFQSYGFPGGKHLKYLNQQAWPLASWLWALGPALGSRRTRGANRRKHASGSKRQANHCDGVHTPRVHFEHHEKCMRCPEMMQKGCQTLWNDLILKAWQKSVAVCPRGPHRRRWRTLNNGGWRSKQRHNVRRRRDKRTALGQSWEWARGLTWRFNHLRSKCSCAHIQSHFVVIACWTNQQ